MTFYKIKDVDNNIHLIPESAINKITVYNGADKTKAPEYAYVYLAAPEHAVIKIDMEMFNKLHWAIMS